MQDFSTLTSCPNSLQKILSTFLMDSAPALLALANSIRLFAKKRCETPKLCLEAFRGIQSFILQHSLMRNPRYSMQRMNIYGERGSPWHFPLVGLKELDLPPLMRIEIVVVDTQLIINLIISLGKQKTWRIFGMNNHSRRS